MASLTPEELSRIADRLKAKEDALRIREEKAAYAEAELKSKELEKKGFYYGLARKMLVPIPLIIGGIVLATTGDAGAIVDYGMALAYAVKAGGTALAATGCGFLLTNATNAFIGRKSEENAASLEIAREDVRLLGEDHGKATDSDGTGSIVDVGP